jgi:beta-galactosidase GanA
MVRLSDCRIMDKILKVDFWKALKFTTKSDGMEFVKSQPELACKLENLEVKLDTVHDDIKSEFLTVWNQPSIKQAKMDFIEKAKRERKTKKAAKDKEQAKIDAKVEIILEDYLEFIPTGWESDPVTREIYTNLALSKTIQKVKQSTLVLLKTKIENKWNAEKDLQKLVDGLQKFKAPLTPPTTP